MQENEFERKVQLKMDAFQLQPTEAVWQNVQSQVTKRKERKRKYIIFFLLLLAFLTSTLWVADMKWPTGSLNSQAGKERENSQQTIPGDNIQHPLQHLAESRHSVLSSLNNDKHDNKKKEENATAANYNTKPGKIKRIIKGIVKIKIAPVVISEASEPYEIVAGKEPPADNNMVVTSEVRKDKENNGSKDNIGGEQLLKEQLKKEPLKENKNETKAKDKPASVIKNKKWHTGVIFSAGLSSTEKRPGAGNDAFDYNSGTSATPGSGNIYSPSVPRPFLSAVTGFSLSRFLSTKIAMAAGLQYQLLTTSIATGDRINSQLSTDRAVFKAGSSNRYISFYHFIELPLSISAEVGTIKHREISVDAGVHLSRLLHTNALQFDYTQGNYYRNNNLFNKTLVGLSAAVFINLAVKGKAPFFIGPDIYYSLTRQASSGMYGQTHYKSFGIRVQKFLQKK